MADPPILPGGINGFWASLFEIGQAVVRIHRLKTGSNGTKEEYYGSVKSQQ